MSPLYTDMGGFFGRYTPSEIGAINEIGAIIMGNEFSAKKPTNLRAKRRVPWLWKRTDSLVTTLLLKLVPGQPQREAKSLWMG